MLKHVWIRTIHHSDAHALTQAAATVTIAFGVLAAILLCTPVRASALEGGSGEEASVNPAAGRFVHVDPPTPAANSIGTLPSGLAPIPLIAGEPGETLEYNGGPVQDKPQLYLLWWGNNFFNGHEPSELQGDLYLFYYGLSHSDILNESWQDILKQYYDNAHESDNTPAVIAAEEMARLPERIAESDASDEADEPLIITLPLTLTIDDAAMERHRDAMRKLKEDGTD
jgi:hypothetical protein